ncbi:proline synthetase associated protein [Infundibulicybe gibba]|nr:proline synthetase associated protein [Infundibulicybe gibba]
MNAGFRLLHRLPRNMSQVTPVSTERAAELLESLTEIRHKVTSASSPSESPTLVAVSKYKPSSDILACYENSQLDFGENYVQELADKAKELPAQIRWHFIGTLQSNKAKTLASIPNLHTIQTLTSGKTATALNKALPSDRVSPLNILIQINTSGEESKSGLAPLSQSSTDLAETPLVQLARHVITECPRLRLGGLMTIGALEQSISASETEKNADFEVLKATRDILQRYLAEAFGESHSGKWGHGPAGRLALSMGMSSDFEAALRAGSDIVRVGTGIFGQRPKKS